MSIPALMLFLAGALTGALSAAGAVLLGYRRGRRLHEKDRVYAAARYAALTHCRRHGTVTHGVLCDALNLPEMTVERYLDLLEREGVLRRHGHGVKTFFTRT